MKSLETLIAEREAANLACTKADKRRGNHLGSFKQSTGYLEAFLKAKKAVETHPEWPSHPDYWK